MAWVQSLPDARRRGRRTRRPVGRRSLGPTCAHAHAIESAFLRGAPNTVLELVEAVDCVERGHLVGVAERWDVEDAVDEVVDTERTGHDGLADVHQLGRRGTEDVNAEDLSRLGVHQELQQARTVSGDLTACELPVAPEAYDVRDFRFGQLALAGP